MSFKANSAFVGKIRGEKALRITQTPWRHVEDIILSYFSLLAFSINDILRRQEDFYQLDLHFGLSKMTIMSRYL